MHYSYTFVTLACLEVVLNSHSARPALLLWCNVMVMMIMMMMLMPIMMMVMVMVTVRVSKVKKEREHTRY
jgi:heme/copper-type cytochrome/quinol oxidase subunit 2